MARLTAPNGVTVSVADDRVELFTGLGFQPVGGGEARVKAKSEADNEGPYAGLKVADLKAEIERRNEGRDEADLLSTEGRKADLLAVLEADDSAASGD